MMVEPRRLGPFIEGQVNIKEMIGTKTKAGWKKAKKYHHVVLSGKIEDLQ